MDTQTHGHTDTWTHRHMDTQTHGNMDTQTHWLTDTLTHRHMDTQTDRQTLSHIQTGKIFMPLFDTFHVTTFTLLTLYMKDKNFNLINLVMSRHFPGKIENLILSGFIVCARNPY